VGGRKIDDYDLYPGKMGRCEKLPLESEVTGPMAVKLRFNCGKQRWAGGTVPGEEERREVADHGREVVSQPKRKNVLRCKGGKD